MKRPQSGFTLMELLIVIGVLGILAAGLLAAIDPFEQLKKARDTNNRSAALELLSASQRYYANHGYLPWFKISTGTTYVCDDAVWVSIRTTNSAYPYNAVEIKPELASGAVYTCLSTTLGTDGEIKSTFFSGLRSNLYLQSGSVSRAAVCFAPEGKSNRSDEQTKYNVATTGTVQVGCTDVQKAAGQCVQCFE